MTQLNKCTCKIQIPWFVPSITFGWVFVEIIFFWFLKLVSLPQIIAIILPVYIKVFVPILLLPLLHRCKRANLRLFHFHCFKRFFLNTAVSVHFQDKAALFASKEGRKWHGAKIALYTILTYSQIMTVTDIKLYDPYL